MDVNIKGFLDRLLCVMFPPRCLSCNQVVYYEDMFCEECGYEHADSESCRRKMGDVPVTGAVVGTIFSGDLRKAIWTIKDKPDIRIVNFFADAMLQEINKNWSDFAFDYVAPIPLSPNKLKERGFNQAGLLAKELSKLLSSPYVDNVLTRDNNSQSQRTLNSKQREENAQKSFRIADPKLVAEKSILLVDDVVTTGATLRICASLLLNAGAKSVYVAAASSTPDLEYADSTTCMNDTSAQS